MGVYKLVDFLVLGSDSYMHINLKNNIDKDQFNWPILLLITFVGFATGIYRDGFCALFPLLQEDFGLTRAQLGLHSTIFFLGNTLSALFTGHLVDLKGSKLGLLYGVLSMGILCIIHSIVQNFIILLLLGALTGFAISINLPASTRGIIDYFPIQWRGTAFGVQSTGFPIGGMIGAILLSSFGVLLGWRKAIIVPGFIAFLCVLIIFYFYKDKSSTNINYNIKGSTDKLPFWGNYKRLFKNKSLVSISILGFF